MEKMVNIKMRKDYYICEKCGEEWEFIPEDYDNEDQYPTCCPLCEMSIWQMAIDVFKEDGISEVIRMIYLQYFRKRK